MSRMPRPIALTGIALASLLVLQLATWQASRAQTCNVRVVIETPDEGATVQPQQPIVGWAVDLSATSGTGIDAIVASLDGALDSPDNRLVGVAEYGAARPDIVDTLGEARFESSGYTLTWDTTTVPGGAHSLFVQAHSACGWNNASRSVVIAGAPAAPTPVVPTATLPVAPATPIPPPTSAAAAPTSATAGAASGLVVTPGAFPPPPTSTALLPPANLRLVSSTANSVTLSWDPPSGPPPSGYLIYQSAVTAAGGNAPPAVVARVPGTATSVTLSGLQDPTRYTYFFTVASAGADGSASPYLLTTVSTTPPNTRVPVPPTPPGGVPSTSGTPTPTLSTTAAAGAPTPAAGGPFTVTASATGSGGATVSWTAQVGAASYNVYGASMMAAPPGQQPLVGSAPNPLASAPPGTWVAVANNVSGTSASVTGLVPGGLYEFLVRAVNSAGQEYSQSSPQQASVPSTTVPPTTAAPPAAPGALPGQVPLPGGGFTLTAANSSSTSVGLTWTPYTGATTYGVLVQRPGSQFVADSTRAALTTTSTTIDQLTAGSQFTFQIVARDATGKELARTNPAPVTVGAPPAPGPAGTGPFPQSPIQPTPVLLPTSSLPIPPPGVPVPPAPLPSGGISGTLQLTSNASEPGTANLQWTPVPGAASYSVWAMASGGQMQVVLPSTQNAAAYLPNLPAGPMTFQVRARDANGTDVAQSNPVSVTIAAR